MASTERELTAERIEQLIADSKEVRKRFDGVCRQLKATIEKARKQRKRGSRKSKSKREVC